MTDAFLKENPSINLAAIKEENTGLELSILCAMKIQMILDYLDEQDALRNPDPNDE